MKLEGIVTSLACAPTHRFSKQPVDTITLLAGLGVEGDAHAGANVRHRSRVAQDPSQPNLRQVHLIEEERFAELAVQGFGNIAPGAIGENIRTRGIALSQLPVGTRLTFARGAAIVLTGLRNPCRQLDSFRRGLMHAMIGREADGGLRLLGGVMGVVTVGGPISSGDALHALLPPGVPLPLQRV